MALEKFWGSVRTAMELFEPPYPKVPRTTAWLNRHAVDGFDPVDFDFLPDDERERLEASVAAFRLAAGATTPLQPPSPDRVEAGGNAFVVILSLLDPMRNDDAELFRVRKILDGELAGKLPDWVQRLSCESSDDWQGEQGITVWVVCSEKASGISRVAQELRGEVRKTVEAAYRWTGSLRRLSVLFQPQAELDCAKAGGR